MTDPRAAIADGFDTIADGIKQVAAGVRRLDAGQPAPTVPAPEPTPKPIPKLDYRLPAQLPAGVGMLCPGLHGMSGMAVGAPVTNADLNQAFHGTNNKPEGAWYNYDPDDVTLLHREAGRLLVVCDGKRAPKGSGSSWFQAFNPIRQKRAATLHFDFLLRPPANWRLSGKFGALSIHDFAGSPAGGSSARPGTGRVTVTFNDWSGGQARLGIYVTGTPWPGNPDDRSAGQSWISSNGVTQEWLFALPTHDQQVPIGKRVYGRLDVVMADSNAEPDRIKLWAAIGPKDLTAPLEWRVLGSVRTRVVDRGDRMISARYINVMWGGNTPKTYAPQTPDKVARLELGDMRVTDLVPA